MSDLLIFRLLAPKAFRGIRFYFALWFWVFMFVMCLGLVIEMLRPAVGHGPTPANSQEHSRRTR